MDKDIKISSDRLSNLEKSVNRIEVALLGDEEMNIKGIADKVKEHDDQLKGYNNLKNKGLGLFAAFSFISSIVFYFIIEAVKAFFHH